jgi:hypothetical protein
MCWLKTHFESQRGSIKQRALGSNANAWETCFGFERICESRQTCIKPQPKTRTKTVKQLLVGKRNMNCRDNIKQRVRQAQTQTRDKTSYVLFEQRMRSATGLPKTTPAPLR